MFVLYVFIQRILLRRELQPIAPNKVSHFVWLCALWEFVHACAIILCVLCVGGIITNTHTHLDTHLSKCLLYSSNRSPMLWWCVELFSVLCLMPGDYALCGVLCAMMDLIELLCTRFSGQQIRRIRMMYSTKTLKYTIYPLFVCLLGARLHFRTRPGRFVRTMQTMHFHTVIGKYADKSSPFHQQLFRVHPRLYVLYSKNIKKT